MNRWDEISNMLMWLVDNKHVILKDGYLFLHPHAFKEVRNEWPESDCTEGTVNGEIFNIFKSSGAPNSYIFYTKDKKRFLSGDIYHEIKLAKIREERNEKL